MSPLSLDALLNQLADDIATRVASRLVVRQAEDRPSVQEPDFMSETEVSRRTGLSRRTLQNWRAAGRGPQYIKTGRKVLYPVAELQDFLKAGELCGYGRSRKRSIGIASRCGTKLPQEKPV